MTSAHTMETTTMEDTGHQTWGVDVGNTTTLSATQHPDQNGPTSDLPIETLRLIHITSIFNLITSIIMSVLVIGYMLWKHLNIYKRTVGERLVFYLAVGDLCFSIAHLTDHVYMLVVINNPPALVCTILGFFMTAYFNIPCVVVVSTAVNAFSMVVMGKKQETGRYDWRLLTGAFVCPQVVMFIAGCLGWLGPNGVWCGFSVENLQGRFLAQVNAILLIIIFIVCVVCYFFIAFKLHLVAESVSSMNASRYSKCVRVMLAFMTSYVLQYRAITLYYTWAFFTRPPLILAFLTITFTNLGGLFNFFAYTYIRRHYQTTKRSGNMVRAQTAIAPAQQGRQNAVGPGQLCQRTAI